MSLELLRKDWIEKDRQFRIIVRRECEWYKLELEKAKARLQAQMQAKFGRDHDECAHQVKAAFDAYIESSGGEHPRSVQWIDTQPVAAPTEEK